MSGRGRGVHFRHYFHPAGHGTFFTGHIRRDDSINDDFVWVYDCGSRRRSHLDRLVDHVAARLAPRNFIDMVCLSHFDSDHVSGIESLLGKVRIGALVLPYLSVEARLRLASSLSETGPSAHRLAAMIVDPTRFLREQGLRKRVERLILVQGGSPAEPGDHADVQLDPQPYGPQGESSRCEIQVSTRPLGIDEVGHQDPRWAELADHSEPWVLGGLYELTFYNTALPHDRTPHSGATLDHVADDVANIVTKFNLCSSSAPTSGWVQDLKKLYRHHFGSSARRKNDISLCVLGRSLTASRVQPCRKFSRLFSHRSLELPLTSEHKRAVVMTGDISLDAAELASLRQHVGPARWAAVGVMQVPHHGSAHSWESGLSAHCAHHHSVICAAPSAHHPHDDVEADLGGRNPVCATYANAVTFDYHTPSRR